jgi:hypothetical protein
MIHKSLGGNMKYIMGIFLVFSAMAQGHAEFHGSFAAVHSNGPACAAVYSVTDYVVRYFATGPGGYTPVLNFRDSNAKGFFNNLSFVAGVGASGDIQAEKNIQIDNVKYRLFLEGIVDYDILYAVIKVKAEKGGGILCEGSAEYTGFFKPSP